MYRSNATVSWLSRRVRLTCLLVFLVSSLLPPYVPKAALAPQDMSFATPQFLLVEDGFIMKSSSITQQGSRRAYASGIVHTVKEGESLDKLANRYGIDVSTIRWANNLDEGDAIRPGEELLVLPVDGVLHRVSRGQNLTMIAELYDIDQSVIADQNNIQAGFLLAGQEIIIPGGQPIVGEPQVAVIAQQPAPTAVDGEVDTHDHPEPGDLPEPEKLPEPTVPSVVVRREGVAFTPTPTHGVLQKPCSEECFITQYYRSGHFALDMQERGGGPIYAAEAGTVIRAEYGWNGGFGNVIEIDHGNGLVTLYAHNKELYVEEGDLVQRGQNIAWMGNTGLVYGKTGIHTHFEVRLRGVKKNPLVYIQ